MPASDAPASDVADPDVPESHPDIDAAGPGSGTGDARVDQALDPLGELDTLPVADHVAVFEHVHRGLQDSLSAIDAS